MSILRDHECILRPRLSWADWCLQPDVEPSRWHEIKLSFKKGDLLGDISKTNRNIARLAKLKPNPLPKIALQSAAAENYNRIRNDARSLYDIFHRIFQVAPICQCDPHDANLTLQKRAVDKADPQPFRLEVVFSNAAMRTPPTWTWREMEFEPIECQGVVNSTEDSACVSLGVSVEAIDDSDGRTDDTNTPPPLSPSKVVRKGLGMRSILFGGKTRSDNPRLASPQKK
jgi:hypothetical protein